MVFMLKPEVCRASRWEVKIGMKKGNKDKMIAARMRAICQEGPEPISVSHRLQDTSSKDEGGPQVNLMLFFRELNTHLVQK